MDTVLKCKEDKGDISRSGTVKGYDIGPNSVEKCELSSILLQVSYHLSYCFCCIFDLSQHGSSL